MTAIMQTATVLDATISDLLATVHEAATQAPNEASLRHAIEAALGRACQSLGYAWSSFTLDLSLRGEPGQRFIDAVHGTLIIEYEPPRSFAEGRAASVVRHAKDQAEEYADILSVEEGREVADYTLCVWDGADLAFANFAGGGWIWAPLQPCDAAGIRRILAEIGSTSRSLVSPLLLASVAGPMSDIGRALLPRLFAAVRDSQAGRTTKTSLLFTEWKRLFGQAVGIETDKLRSFLDAQSHAHGTDYATDVPAYLFALHTYIGIIAKLAAAFSLPRASEDLADGNVPLTDRITAMEEGRLFPDSGVANMLSGDFFSWYIDRPHITDMLPSLERLVEALAFPDYDSAKKNPSTSRDLFKGLYQDFVPRELRHALGEIYTPDYLAAHALDLLDWQPEDDFLDPTGGSGTFVLEALRRRVIQAAPETRADNLLSGLYAIDLNPLAVLCAKASMVVMLGNRLDPFQPVRLPVYLGDAINVSDVGTDDIYEHCLPTELGEMTFRVPGRLVRDDRFHTVFEELREVITATDREDETALLALPRTLCDIIRVRVPDLPWTPPEEEALTGTMTILSLLHKKEWDGIWCPILADRFAAAAIPPVSHIGGNPPWVKWSHLPAAYAAFIKPLCRRLSVFSEDTYVGGIQADIATVITFSVIKRWLRDSGKLGFYITGTVFSNESSPGFRRFKIDDQHGGVQCQVTAVEDFQALQPFDGATTHATLLLLQRQRAARFPVPYRIWSFPENFDRSRRPLFDDGEDFRRRAKCVRQLAAPVPGTDAGPWLKGSAAQHAIWRELFDASRKNIEYTARKGVTVDLNGVYLLEVQQGAPGGLCMVANDPSLGRKRTLKRVQRVIEQEHVFPLLRGRGIRPFKAEVDPDHCILVPQRGMHGDPNLAVTAPKTFSYLAQFKADLEQRGSYRRYQSKQPFWSTWSTGPYTFSPYKVLWQEMAGNRFAAAYVGSVDHPVLGRKLVLPNHKAYFVPANTEAEAQYLTGLLNAPTISEAVGAYAAQLSLGTSVIEYLKLPKYDPDDPLHREIAKLVKRIVAREGSARPADNAKLDQLALEVIHRHSFAESAATPFRARLLRRLASQTLATGNRSRRQFTPPAGRVFLPLAMVQAETRRKMRTTR